MLKLFENRFINTTNKLVVSIEDIKLGRFGGEEKGRDGGGGGGACITHDDVMSVLTEQHNSLLLVLAAQTQKLDKLEQVCLHRTRSDEQRECSAGGEPPRCEFAPKMERILQTVSDLKERLTEAQAEVLDLQDDLEEEKSRVKELQGKLRSAQQALNERARERRSLGNKLKIERFQAHLNTLYAPTIPMHASTNPTFVPRRPRSMSPRYVPMSPTYAPTSTTYAPTSTYQQPFSAKATDRMSEGTPTVLPMQAELLQMSNHSGGRGRGRDTERPRVPSFSARSPVSFQSEMTDQSRSEQRNRIIQDIDLFRRGGRDAFGARESSVPSEITDQSRSEQRNRLIQDIDLFRALSKPPSSKVSLASRSDAIFLKPDADGGGGGGARVRGVRSGAGKALGEASRERFARESSKGFLIETSSSARRSDSTRQVTLTAARQPGTPAALQQHMSADGIASPLVKESGGSTKTRGSAGESSSGVGGRDISLEAKLVRGAFNGPLTRYQPVASLENNLSDGVGSTRRRRENGGAT
jgi:hypothetical protein